MNKSFVRKIANRYFRKNIGKNIIIILAIMLTTILFTTIFSAYDSMTRATEETTMRQIGTTSDVTFSNISYDMADKIMKHPAISGSGVSVFLGVLADENSGPVSEIHYEDNISAEYTYVLPLTEGEMPKRKNEIATSTVVLDQLGIKHEIGETITIKWKKDPNDSVVHTDTFQLVGYWEIDVISSHQKLLVTEEFCKDNLSETELLTMVRLDTTYKDNKSLKDTTNQILKDTGLENEGIKCGYSWAYKNIAKAVLPIRILAAIAVLLIVLCGYLIISNTIQISLSNQIREYGLLKVVGVRNRELKIIVKQQILYLCVIGIPIGLAVGYAISQWMIPIIMNNKNGDMKNEVHVMVFLFSAVFTMITVVISSQKAIHKTVKIPPIISLRYVESTDYTTRKYRNSKKEISIRSMALRNVKRNKKRFYITIISLSMGLILLNSIYTLSTSFDIDTYLQDIILSDYVLSDSTLHNSWYNPKNKTISEDLIKKIESMDSIDSYGSVFFHETTLDLSAKAKKIMIDVFEQEKVYDQLSEIPGWLDGYEEFKETGNVYGAIYGVDDSLFSKVEIYKGTLDLNKLKTQNYVIAVGGKDNSGNVNDDIGDFVLIDGQQYEVMCYADIGSLCDGTNTISAKAISKEYLMSSDLFKEKYPDGLIRQLHIDVDKNDQQQFEKELETYKREKEPNIYINGKQKYVDAYKKETLAQDVMGKMISGIMLLIGVLNFVNCEVSFMLSRKKEFALMRCIGMTKKQLQKMLTIEGLYYVFYTLIVSVVAGSIVSYYGVRYYLEQDWTAIYHFTLGPIILSAIFLGVLAYIIPKIILYVANKDTLIEAIKRND